MEYVVLGITLLGLFLLIFAQGMHEDQKRKKKAFEEMKAEYGKKPLNKYNQNELDIIKDFFYRNETEQSIDDITAGDLELDDIFKRINYCRSSMGASVLYNILRNPVKDNETARKTEGKIFFLQENEEKRMSLRRYFNDIGKLKVSLFECLDILDDLEPRNLLADFAAIFLFLIAVAVTCFKPYIGIVFLVLILCYNIITYYSARGRIEPYLISFGYIYSFIKIAKTLALIKTECIQEEIDNVNVCVSRLKGFTKHANFVINSNSGKIGAGNPLEIFLDYLKMLFHVDIIFFYKMLNVLKENENTVTSLYSELGKIESYISIAYFRASLEEYAVPENADVLSIVDAYHPLIDNPVKNSITANRGVLITGSNASGKSTFLKTIALNALFAQTIFTCTAKKYSGKYYDIFSSMALRDNLSGNDSYFMVEIKAMKRILDYTKAHPDSTVLCFVDEVLRGTNTLERIASSTEILKYLSTLGTICFAATHDGELTYLLENVYDNYHFEEEIENDDVKFNYRLNEGRAMTRNAIKLLGVMGFPEAIISHADSSANQFLKTGEWK